MPSAEVAPGRTIASACGAAAAGAANVAARASNSSSPAARDMGLEDHLGDMDFKVAGKAQGVTAIQMDIKTIGVSHAIMGQVLEQARQGRMHILQAM